MTTTVQRSQPTTGTADAPVLEVEDLKVYFTVRRMLKTQVVQAVDGVSFNLQRGRTLGLVGESGCGKSTTARTILRLEEPTAGRILLEGRDITHLQGEDLRKIRKDIQIVFQDPFSALNPRLTVAQIIAEPMQAQGFDREHIRRRTVELLELVGLHPRYRNNFPHQFSGGQRQRIGTARALATQPKVLILDEPVSALDVSVQAQVVNLFADIQREFDMGMVFISHDLSVVRHVSDDIVVMYLGQIVEQGDALDVIENPAHPYTQALISAAPGRNTEKSERIVLRGDAPSPINPPTGCRFASRCWKATDRCREAPPLAVPAGGTHPVACWYPDLPGTAPSL